MKTGMKTINRSWLIKFCIGQAVIWSHIYFFFWKNCLYSLFIIDDLHEILISNFHNEAKSFFSPSNKFLKFAQHSLKLLAIQIFLINIRICDSLILSNNPRLRNWVKSNDIWVSTLFLNLREKFLFFFMPYNILTFINIKMSMKKVCSISTGISMISQYFTELIHLSPYLWMLDLLNMRQWIVVEIVCHFIYI